MRTLTILSVKYMIISVLGDKKSEIFDIFEQ